MENLTLQDQQKIFKESFEKVKNQLLASNVQDQAELIAKKSCVITKRLQSVWSYEEIRQLVCNGNLEYKQELEKISKNMQDTEETYLKNFGIKFKAGVGELLPKFTGLLDVFTNQENVELAHQPGEILLIELWATWCGPCQNSMQNSATILQKNETTWKDKVRIVAVSVDEKKEVAIQRVLEKQWKKMQHCKLNGWDKEHDLIKLFEVQGIPFIILVDKTGRVSFTGHPGKVNLEEKINELLKMTDQECKDFYLASKKKQEEEFNKRSLITKQEYSEVREFLKTEFLSLITEKYPDFKGRFGIIMLKEKLFKNGAITKEYYKPIIDFIIDKREENQTRELLEFLKDKYGKERFLVGIQNVTDSKGVVLTHMKDLSNILNELNVTCFRFCLRRDLVLMMGKNKQIIKQKGEELGQYGEMAPGDITADNLQKIRARFRFYGDMLFQQKKNFDIVKKLLASGPQISLKGTKFLSMPEMYKLNQQEVACELAHQQGVVYIIDFFLFKFQPCLEKVNQYKKLYEENKEKWCDKVKFVAACLEPQKEKTLQLYNENQWSFMEFYFFKQDLRFRSEFMHYRIQQMPHICIVDKFGAINYNGESKSVDISTKIDELLNATTVTKSEPKKNKNMKKAETEYDTVKNLIQSANTDASFQLLKKLSYDPKLIIKVTRDRVFNTKGEMVEKIYRKPEIGFGIKKEDAHIVDEFFKIHDKNHFKVEVEYLENL
ncbi:hypothetical protein ABPG72_007668 [Tetrahymena utriculariae]